MQGVRESLVRDADLVEQVPFDGMPGSGSGEAAGPGLQDQHGGTRTAAAAGAEPAGRHQGTELRWSMTLSLPIDPQPHPELPAGQTPQNSESGGAKTAGAATHSGRQASLWVLGLDGSNISNAGKCWQHQFHTDFCSL